MANVFDQVQAPTPFPPASGPGAGPGHPERVWGYAGFWWRVLAYLIDSVILVAASMLVRGLFAGNLIAVNKAGPTSNSLFKISDLGGAMPADSVQLTHMWQLQTLGWPGLIGLLLPIAYFTLLESSPLQASLGKYLCRLRVTRLDGSRISLPRALGRYLGKFVSALILGVGFLMIAWTLRKQGLHDIMAGTLVVRLRSPSDLVRFNPPG